MDAKGITFNFDGRYNRPVSCTVTLRGDQDEYIRKIKSLLQLIRNVKEDMIDPDQICDVCDLIEDMLPTPEQINIKTPVKNTPNHEK